MANKRYVSKNAAGEYICKECRSIEKKSTLKTNMVYFYDEESFFGVCDGCYSDIQSKNLEIEMESLNN